MQRPFHPTTSGSPCSRAIEFGPIRSNTLAVRLNRRVSITGHRRARATANSDRRAGARQVIAHTGAANSYAAADLALAVDAREVGDDPRLVIEDKVDLSAEGAPSS